MIAVVFYLEDSPLVHDSVEQVMTRRIFDARMLGATDVFMIDNTQYRIGQYYKHADGMINFKRFESLADVLSSNSEEKFVYLENDESFISKGITNHEHLKTYVHPESCVYVTGPDTGSVNILDIAIGDCDFVNIEVDNIWSETAINIVLWDRKVKADGS